MSNNATWEIKYYAVDMEGNDSEVAELYQATHVKVADLSVDDIIVTVEQWELLLRILGN